MKLSIYEFHIEAREEGVFSHPLPFVIHSVMGESLKRLTCVLRHKGCADCLLKRVCIYSIFFESLPPPEGSPRWLSEMPKPYAIRSDQPLKRTFTGGEEIRYEIVLFGDANEYLPYLVKATQDFCKIGIGRRKDDGLRPEFVLKRILQDGKNILTKRNNLRPNDSIDLSIILNQDLPNDIKAIKVDLLTPLRIKKERQLTDDVNFSDFFKATLRRIISLETTYGDKNFSLSYDELMEIANKVSIVESNTRWIDWKRYSSRQRTEMFFGGVVGEMIISGENIHKLLPYLQYVEKTSLGKQTTFGLGVIKIETLT